MRKKSIRLLIIDDELQILEIAKAFLVSLNGFEVDVSPSAREAIERIRMNKYDAIISDYQMPEMNGIEFLKSLRSGDDLTPFILFTGKGREEVVIEALNSGADFYLQKGGEPKAQFAELANMVHKVVQKRRTELELVENEEKFKSIFNSANDAIYIIAPEGRILEINDIGCTRLGYTRQEMLKRNVMDFDSGQYAKQVPDRLKEVMETGFALFETELIPRSGSPLPSEVSSRRISYLGRPAILSVIRDVTERKRNENELLDTTEKCFQQYSTLSGIIESSDSPIFSVDRNYNYTIFNKAHARAMKRASGFDIELGKSTLDHLHDEARHFEEKSYIDGALRGERIVTEVHLVDEELGNRFFEVAYNPISDACDKVTGVAVISRDISHRKKAQLDFEANEEKLRTALSASNEGTLLWKENFRFFNTLMDTIPIPIFYKDKERKYKGCNGAFESLIGLPRSQIIGKNVYEISPKELADQYDSADDQIFESKVSQDYESQVRDADGALHDVIFHKAPFFGTNGEVDGFIGAIIDITNEKKREAELKRSEERYRSLFDGLADGIVSVDIEGRILDFNQSYQRMTGYSDNELHSLRYQDITPEKWHPMESRIIQGQVLVRGYSDLYEKEYRRKDGTIFPVEIHAYSIHDRLGKIPGMWAIVRDITERKKVGEVLRRERDLAQTYLDVAGFIIIRLNDKGVVTLINRKGCEILGCDSKDVIGKKWIDAFVPKSHRAKTERVFDHLKEGEIAATEYFENPVIGKGREERIIAWHNLVLRDKEGAIIGTLSSGEDITERKRKEEELRQMGEKLSLLSNVTRHDILNEVTVQMGYLDLIRNRTTDIETLALIEKARFATGAIRSQIEFTKVYQGAGILAPKWQDVNAIVSSLMIPKGIDLSLGCTEVEILADPMLSLVFCNLLDNLVRHGEHATSLKVSCSRKDAGLSIVWEDNGVGVPDDKKELIFSRGFGKNTGMGLFLIRQILSITGIRIVENGVEGKGARFEMLVPLNGFRCREPQSAGQEDQRQMKKSSGLTRHK